MLSERGLRSDVLRAAAQVAACEHAALRTFIYTAGALLQAPAPPSGAEPAAKPAAPSFSMPSFGLPKVRAAARWKGGGCQGQLGERPPG